MIDLVYSSAGDYNCTNTRNLERQQKPDCPEPYKPVSQRPATERRVDASQSEETASTDQPALVSLYKSTRPWRPLWL